HVSRMTRTMPGTTARPRPKAPISAIDRKIPARVPIHLTTHGAAGANRPMQRTGIVPSRPITVCETPRSSWISGKIGPAPTICGRNVNPARKSAASIARAPVDRTSVEWRPVRAGALLHERERLAEQELLHVLRLLVRTQRVLVRPALVEKEHPRVFRIPVRLVLEAPRLGARGAGQQAEDLGDAFLGARPGDPPHAANDRQRPSRRRRTTFSVRRTCERAAEP